MGIFVYVCVCVCVCVCMHVCVCMCMCVCMWLCVYVCLHVCMYVWESTHSLRSWVCVCMKFGTLATFVWVYVCKGLHTRFARVCVVDGTIGLCGSVSGRCSLLRR